MGKQQTILYLMHVDWDWIKQRPHFIAEGLVDHFDVKVIHKSERGNTNLTPNPRGKLQTIALPNLPMQRFKIGRSIDKMCRHRLVKCALKKYNPDYLWITHPEMYRLAAKYAKCEIIYDCMDDVPGFFETGSERWRQLEDLERQLIREASHIFVSSENLIKVIDAREPCRSKLTLVRNAYAGDILRVEETREKEKGRFRVCYFGTVSDWFDWDSLHYCLDKMPELEFQVIGPHVNTSPFNHERLIITGPVEHSKLGTYVEQCDCFMMPFTLSDLLLSVDPVKLYEYINFNKPIVTVYYDEIKRFEPFVSFYTNKEEMAAAIASIIKSPQPKYSLEQRIEFLQANGWNNRVETIVRTLKH